MSKSIYVVIIASGLVACQPQPQSSSAVASQVESVEVSTEESVAPLAADEISAAASAFMQAVTSDDPARLRGYYPDGYDVRELTPDMPDPMFARQALRPIIATGPMAAKEIARKGHTFSILFYQARYKDRLDDKKYLETQYLKSFFVCNFDDSSGSWKVSHPILCYDETEGPYEPEPDV